jgi:hypothetical protein
MGEAPSFPVSIIEAIKADRTTYYDIWKKVERAVQKGLPSVRCSNLIDVSYDAETGMLTVFSVLSSDDEATMSLDDFRQELARHTRGAPDLE